jgi:hypothetical protein
MPTVTMTIMMKFQRLSIESGEIVDYVFDALIKVLTVLNIAKFSNHKKKHTNLEISRHGLKVAPTISSRFVVTNDGIRILNQIGS